MSVENPAITLANDMVVHQAPNEGMTVNVRDWNRIRKGIGDLPNTGNGFQSAGWGFTGIAVAAAMQLISFAATSNEIAIPLLILAIAALCVGLSGAIVSFIAWWSHRGAQTKAKADLQDDMDDLLPEGLRH